MYNPTISRTFSTSSGSFGNVKVSLRCGWRPKARQIRLTAMRLRPNALAISRVLQCVAPRGVVSSVRTITRSIWSSVIVRGAPGRGSSYKPSSRCRTNRPRHLHTVAGVTRRRRATTLLSRPSPHAKTIRARRATWGADRVRCASDSSRLRSSSVSVKVTFGASRAHARLLVEAIRTSRAIYFTFYWDRTLA